MNLAFFGTGHYWGQLCFTNTSWFFFSILLQRAGTVCIIWWARTWPFIKNVFFTLRQRVDKLCNNVMRSTHGSSMKSEHDHVVHYHTIATSISGSMLYRHCAIVITLLYHRVIVIAPLRPHSINPHRDGAKVNYVIISGFNTQINFTAPWVGALVLRCGDTGSEYRCLSLHEWAHELIL